MPSDSDSAPASASKQAASERRAGRATGLGLAAAEQEVPVEAEGEGHGGERVAVHESGAAGGQEALVLVGIAVEQEAADGQADDGIAIELEPLVVAGDEGGVLVEVGAVDERLPDQLRLA